MLIFTKPLMSIFVQIEMVFLTIFEIFHGRISLNVLLWLLQNYVSGSSLELMYKSPIVIIKSSPIHLHGFQLLVLLP